MRTKDAWAEDIAKLSMDILNLAEGQFQLDEVQSDHFYESVRDVLDEMCGYPPYRNNN